MLFKFQKIVGCIEPWVKNRDTNRIVSLCIVTALVIWHGEVPACPCTILATIYVATAGKGTESQNVQNVEKKFTT